MGKTSMRKIEVNISEKRTIVELSQLTELYQSEILLKKTVHGSAYEINLKSFLGLITLQLKNGDQIIIQTIGEDCEEALEAVASFLSGTE